MPELHLEWLLVSIGQSSVLQDAAELDFGGICPNAMVSLKWQGCNSVGFSLNIG